MENGLKEMVRDLIARYIDAKPKRISLRLSDDRSEIRISGDGLEERLEYPLIISFTSFVRGVIKAYEEVYGKLRVIPISLREEVYENDKVSLDLYPTGGSGIFEVFVSYKEHSKKG